MILKNDENYYQKNLNYLNFGENMTKLSDTILIFLFIHFFLNLKSKTDKFFKVKMLLLPLYGILLDPKREKKYIDLILLAKFNLHF